MLNEKMKALLTERGDQAGLAPGEGEKRCKACGEVMYRKRWLPKPYNRPGDPQHQAASPYRQSRKTGILESRAVFAKREFCSKECSGRYVRERGCLQEGCPNRGVRRTARWNKGPYCGLHASIENLESDWGLWEQTHDLEAFSVGGFESRFDVDGHPAESLDTETQARAQARLLANLKRVAQDPERLREYSRLREDDYLFELQKQKVKEELGI